MFEDLQTIRTDCGSRLADAAENRRSPMHTPAVVTSDIDARVMVLRAFDSETWTLRFHTDIRAPKSHVIAADPRMAVLLYDKSAKVQIRARGKGYIVHQGEAAEKAWAAGSNFARRCYLGDGPGTPGERPTSGLPDRFEGVEPSDDDLVPARENFAVLLVEIEALDWLYLAHTGHVRALFERDGDMWDGRWVSP